MDCSGDDSPSLEELVRRMRDLDKRLEDADGEVNSIREDYRMLDDDMNNLLNEVRQYERGNHLILQLLQLIDNPRPPGNFELDCLTRDIREYCREYGLDV